MHELAKGTMDGDMRSAARAMRAVDDRTPAAQEILRDIFPTTGRAFILGVTGNPGAGKSTLCDRLIAAYRAEQKKVGVLCVDPSSPYSGGAILGDRIRMNRHSTDPGVFIRSVATRGHLGGLSRSARDLVRVLDAFGSDVVIVETVGVGQDELEVTRTAHTTLVVMAPGMGDEVQAIKAGILECADVFAVNKADRDGADATIRDLELMIALGKQSMVAVGKHRGHVVHSEAAGLAHEDSDGGGGEGDSMSPHKGEWTPPIVKCVALRNEGTTELTAAIAKHREWLDKTEAGKARRHTRLAEELREGLREALIDAAVSSLSDAIDRAVGQVERREVDPYTATDQLVSAFRKA